MTVSTVCFSKVQSMLLSHRYRFLFVHIAKTGGTSIRALLKRCTWADPYRLPQLVCSRLSGWTGHRIGCKFPRHAKVVAAAEMLPPDFFRSLFKFAFVRNPWDLQVSSYHHVSRERPHLMRGIDDFETFLRWKLEDERRPHHYILDASAEPQRRSVIDLQGEVVVDFVGRYENLESDFRTVCRRIGIRNVPGLPRKRMARNRQDYRRYYSGRAAEYILEHFREDVETFGYAFDDPGSSR
jgi:hypothetical protein